MRRRVEGRPRPSTLLVFGREPGSLRRIQASGGYGFLHDLLELAGGSDVLVDLQRQSVEMSTEMVLARAPEVIIELQYGDSPRREQIDAETRVWNALPSVPAVRSKQVHLLVGDEFVVPGPRIVAGRRALRARAASGCLQMKRVLVSWSSGKDSAWLVHVLRQTADVEIGGLLTTINEAADRVAMHAVRTELLQAQADALGLPLRTSIHPVSVPERASTSARWRAAWRAAVADGFTHVAFGDLFLEDVRRYREEKLAGSGLTPLFPLFGADTAPLAREMVASGLRARITCVNPAVLDRSFAGREFDAALLANCRHTVDPCGERGEFHTLRVRRPDVLAADSDRERRSSSNATDSCSLI